MNVYPRNSRKLSVAVSATAMLLSSQSGFSQEGPELPFSEAQLYFELNHTDGDLGFHGLIDGDAWKSLEIEAPNESLLMNVWVRNALRRQGMTEIFFESDEPSFDELTPAQFFSRFPAGIYEVEGITLDDEELEAEIRVSHVMPGPPGGIKVNGKNSAANCDATLPVVSEPVTLDWNAVTKSHPTVGTPNVNVTVLTYEVVGEIEREGQNPDVLVFSATLPRNVTEFEFPETFTGLADGEMKFEIVTKLTNGNQTAVESCFEIE
ncbi:MAG TPA: hypothetical protein VJN00_05905 [Steroidobacteraceae bacterium]|nr:hypothetical protein [Steroidobacteraceae bacterium]